MPQRQKFYLLDLPSRVSIFPTLEFSTHIAQKLCEGALPSTLGTPCEKHLYITDFVPKVRTQRIEGTVIYIDHFGNVVSNITVHCSPKRLRIGDFMYISATKVWRISPWILFVCSTIR